MSFVHLHTHSHYTFQRALGDPQRIVARAKELDQSAIALTDAGNMYGAFEFYEACRDMGIQPIIGVEFTLSKKGRSNREKGNELYEIVLLAKNQQGYKNLIQLVTFSQLEGYVNGRPRIDFDLLEEYSEHLIALSGSLYGEIGQMISTGKSDTQIIERIEYYISVFGRENYFLEIEEHPDKSLQPHINHTIVRIAREYNYEYVGTNNSYYVVPDDASVQDIMMSVADGRALDDPDRPTLTNGDYSLRSSREMEELFVYAPKAYENTEKIASMIDLHLDVGGYKIPKFPLSDEQHAQYMAFAEGFQPNSAQNSEQYQQLSEEEWFLRKLCIGGLGYRYGFDLTGDEQEQMIAKRAGKKSKKNLSEMSLEELHQISLSHFPEAKKSIIAKMSDKQREIVSRLEYELLIVDMMGFNGYFCIVADFIQYAKTHDVPVGPGRGSAAGAILAYLSGITDIDPLLYGLLFERFLNPSRVTMPDIDVDFSDEGRDIVLTYVREKYGSDHVAQVCTFGTLAARAAVKDAGRAFGIPFQEMNDFAKLIPGKPGITITKALEESIEFQNAYTENEKYHRVVDTAIKMEGSVRQLGVHACAVIIAPEPMIHFCPLQPPPKDPNSIVTQFSAGPLEALGLLKMDFLGLRNLAILDRARKIALGVHGKNIDLLKIDYEDPCVLELFGHGDMTGVFQFESDGMRRYLKELKPSSFEDLIAMVSLYRPGPMLYIPDFIDRKFGRKKVEYPHPSLEAILRHTYGIAIYQEQIMQLVQAFAGFSLGEADILRRAIGKKKYELLMEQRGKFIDAAIACGHKEDLAVYIFDEIIKPFAGYGFNKSHAACYAMIAYQTAYMKAYYPTEFMTAMMTSDEEDTDRIRLEITEAREKNIDILPPDVNESRKHFTYIDDHTIRFGLKAIKGLGDGPIDTILEKREQSKFSTLADFIERTGSEVVNKRALESLVCSGALDSFGERASLLASIPKMSAYQKEISTKRETLQIGLFDTESDGEYVHFSLENAAPMSLEDRIKGETNMIGYPVSGHPLQGLETFIHAKSKNLGIVRDLLRTKEDEDFSPHEGERENIIPSIEDSERVLTENTFLPPLEIYDEGESAVTEDQAGVPPPDTPDTKEKDDGIFAQLIGVVKQVKKMHTRSGGMILIATIESIGFDFRILVFPKDYDLYEEKIIEDMIVVANGRVRFDRERGELSLIPSTPFGKGKKMEDIQGSVKCFSISMFREMAQRSGMMDQENTEKIGTSENATEYISRSNPDRYMIDVPAFWSRDDLLELRQYLEQAETGGISVWIRVHGGEKNTKFSLASTEGLRAWLEKKGA